LSFAQAPESILGVFNKNCMIDYSNFKNIFPMWALARYTQKYPDEAVAM
jgi:squalene cyclase